MNILAPISVGELIDKITILQIKNEELTDIKKVVLVIRELYELNKLADDIDVDLDEETAELKRVNKIIWDNEDIARTYGPNKPYDDAFAKLAAVTYENNTRRAEIKRNINIKCKSYIIETKSYMDTESCK